MTSRTRASTGLTPASIWTTILVDAILTNPDNRGIVFGPAIGATGDNWKIFSRESNGFGGRANVLPGPVTSFLEVTYAPKPTLLGDFDESGVLDLPDVNMMNVEIASNANNAKFDLNSDTRVDGADLSVWVRDLRKTWFGDANLDGQFDSGDLVAVFQGGKFELDTHATWDEGDWNGDLRFNSGDLVRAFQDGWI